ncbi:MAG TPA: tetratricopeptide repeat protein [Vicinamibacteria bacterium]|nr:tetratricopeptide repeat protein [Vicinamibacteria bacterium]
MKKPVSTLERRTQQALERFEKGMKALGKRDYEKALGLFDEVISDHAGEAEVVERARSYRSLCQRAMGEARRPAFRPKGFEDLLNHGVFLHNRGDYGEALKFLRQAAEIHPRNEHVLYCLAATASRAGELATALKALRSAIVANPASRAQAKADADFDPIRHHDEFLDIVSSQAS